jgi:TfoX/Sxy family transcriptional regulator of competence genes
MATDASFAEYVLEQIALPRRAEARRMFGEYALYVDGKVVALLCDDQLFLKPLEALRARLARVDEADGVVAWNRARRCNRAARPLPRTCAVATPRR